ncbi:IucA/IucC family protein [Salibacterium aidingense]|uniref:IucA/IucC family protein n=1 Tax=Salibacterium aidingense TaxID=384933 RepID=UPI003BBC4693
MISTEALTPLRGENWKKANRRLTGKMLQEFLYENIIQAETETKKGEDRYRFQVELGDAVYTFEVIKRLFNSFHVFEETIEKEKAGKKLPVLVQDLLLELQQTAPISSETASHLIKEYYHTLAADCHLLDKTTTAADMAEMDYAELEGEMNGHPWITYNKGRIGFSYADYLDYAPEQQQPVRLFWLAVHHTAASFQTAGGWNEERLLEHELTREEREHFRRIVQQAGADPCGYYFMPVHTWQWEHQIITLYADYLADKRLIPLDFSKDEYLPQQSIRTFVNRTNRHKHHVKLPISILNTLVYRGLPSERTRIAPDVTEWVQDIREEDEFLRDICDIGLLGEIGSIDVAHDRFHSLPGAPYSYLELLGTVWRESIYEALKDEEHPMTLAALLHQDAAGRPLAQELIERSGLAPKDWIEALCRAILPPLLHYLYKYGTVFSPHGQNAIVVLKQNIPQRLIMKDFVDDVNISDQPLPELSAVPEQLKTVLRREPPQGLVQFIFTGLFICHFRYLADLLDVKGLLDEKTFWRQAAQTISSYQDQFPELSERFKLFDLFQPTMTKLCLNRNRMLEDGYREGDDRPHAAEHGQVENPLSACHHPGFVE